MGRGGRMETGMIPGDEARWKIGGRKLEGKIGKGYMRWRERGRSRRGC